MNHICTFYQKECQDISPKVQQSDIDWELPSYHACKDCNVAYQITPDNKLEFTRFYASLKVIDFTPINLQNKLKTYLLLL